MKRTFILLMTAIPCIGLYAHSNTIVVGADLIVHNAKITTQTAAQPEASALAVKGGRIYAVGNDSEILYLRDGHTQIINEDCRRLIPGLEDVHIHPLKERNYNYKVRWDGVSILKRALEMLTEQAKRTPVGLKV